LNPWNEFVHGFSWLIQALIGLTTQMGIPNYGLAIIFMTIVIKVVLFPLTNVQLKSMRGMQELQPKLKELQEKYKDDPQKMQAQMMNLYKEKGVNPFSGCLPLLIQLPILMAFYQALYKFHYTNVAHASFLWIKNLSNAGPQEGISGLLLPILAALTTYYQQKISTVDTNDPTQRSMLIFMPIFIGWMAYKFQAGLALYWVMFNVLSIAQQLWVNKRYSLKTVAVGEGAAVETTVDVEGTKQMVSKKGTKGAASMGDDFGGQKKTAGGKGGKGGNNGNGGAKKRKNG